MQSIKPSLTVELTGGLANQLFQWAAGFILSAESGAELVLDSRLVDRPDGRGLQLESLVPSCSIIAPSARERVAWTTIHHHLPRRVVGVAKRFRRTSLRLGSVNAGTYADARRLMNRREPKIRLVGLFQEVEELVSQRHKIVHAIRLPARTTEYRAAQYAAVHVRRGDYVHNPKYRQIFGVCSEEYYRSGIERLPDALPIVIATDDREWARKLLGSDSSRDVRLAQPGNHFDDFGILAGAKELVLSNSTFSWWAAFLSDANNIIAPKPWFSDPQRDRGLILPSWTTLPREGRRETSVAPTS